MRKCVYVWERDKTVLLQGFQTLVLGVCFQDTHLLEEPFHQPSLKQGKGKGNMGKSQEMPCGSVLQ